MAVIDSFSDEFRFLSNFYPATILFGDPEDQLWYPTAEHAYQAQKTNYMDWRVRIQKAEGPNQAKRLGNLAPLRPEWEFVKLGIMYGIVNKKFRSHKELAHKLKATGDAELVEGNWWNDTYWGVCEGEGQNWLGQILMCVRKQLP